MHSIHDKMSNVVEAVTAQQTVYGDGKSSAAAKTSLEQKVKEPTPSKTVAADPKTAPSGTVPVVAEVNAVPAETVPVVAVQTPKVDKTAAVLPATAVNPAANASVPVTKFAEADAYAVLPPAVAPAGSTSSTGPVEPSDGLKEANFHLIMGGTGHSVVVKGSWDNWSEEVDCSGDGGGMVRLKPGTYQYKYILDGQWINDAGNTVLDADGNVNNVLEV